MPPIMPDYRQKARKRMRQGLLVQKYLDQAPSIEDAARQARTPSPAPMVQAGAPQDAVRKAMQIAAHQGVENPTAVPLSVATNTTGNERAGKQFQSFTLGGQTYHVYNDGTVVKGNLSTPADLAAQFAASPQVVNAQAHHAVPGARQDERNEQMAQTPAAEMRARVLARWLAENDPQLEKVKRRMRRA